MNSLTGTETCRNTVPLPASPTPRSDLSCVDLFAPPPSGRRPQKSHTLTRCQRIIVFVIVLARCRRNWLPRNRARTFWGPRIFPSHFFFTYVLCTKRTRKVLIFVLAGQLLFNNIADNFINWIYTYVLITYLLFITQLISFKNSFISV